MALSIGARIGPYEVTGALGAGGMGEVYRATDGNLKRSVAIKVLPALVADDADRLARFQREAEALAALNHPNIAGIYGVEKTPDLTAIVMELVEGDDLSAHIARGPMPLVDALPVAKQITEALEAAHERGIVHRDLKPANIKVRADGTVKVLDFGLAKAMAPAEASSAAVANSPTLTARATAMGMVLGTAAYMAPEQARGKAVDRRADVWAFGCVFYEMLTGTRAFAGDDITDVLAAVVRAEPEWSLLPNDLSPTLQVFLRRCLHKDAKQRIGDIHDVRLALDGAFDTPAPPALPVVAAAPHKPLWRRAVPIAAAVIVTAAVAGGVMWFARPAARERVVSRFVVPFGEGQERRLTYNMGLAISRDGKTIAYVANDQIYLRPLGDLSAHVLTRTGSASVDFRGPRQPEFSPDGQSLAYVEIENGRQVIKKIEITGGAAVTLTTETGPQPQAPYLDWLGDDIFFATLAGGSISRVRAAGGQPEPIIQLEKEEVPSRPQVLADGRVLFAVAQRNQSNNYIDWTAGRIMIQRPGEKTRTTLVTGGTDPRYVPSGHLIYQLNGVIYARTMDLSRLTVGGAVPVVDGVFRGVGGHLSWYAVSDTGTLVYLPGPVSAGGVGELALAWFDRAGKAELLNVPAGPYSEPRMSPDGRRIAFCRTDARDTSIWVYELAGGGSARRLTSGGHDRFPVWSADSQRVIFQSDREGDLGLFWQRADGVGTAERLTKPAKDVGHVPQSAAVGGKVLLVDQTTNAKTSLMVFTFADRSMKPFGSVTSPYPTGAMFSPDGRWVAYSLREGSSYQTLHVQPFPPTGQVVQISTGIEDAHHAAWSADSQELYYNPGPGSRQAAVKVMASQGFAFGPAPPVVKAFYSASGLVERTYDVAHDGQRFLGLIAPASAVTGAVAGGPRPELRVVLNWFDELKARAPVGK